MARKTKAAEGEQERVGATAHQETEIARGDQAVAGAVETTGETEWEPADPAWVTEDVTEYEEEAAARRRAGATVKPPDGKSHWRILPPIKGTKRLWHRVWVHSWRNDNINAATKILAALPDLAARAIADKLGVMEVVATNIGNGFAATVCPSKMEDKECQRCKMVSVLYEVARQSKALDAAAGIARELASKEEFFVNAVRLDDPKEMERGPRALQLTIGLFEGLVKIFHTPETDEQLGGDFSHPKTGFTIIIDKDKTGKKIKVGSGPGSKEIDETEYKITAGRRRSEIANYEWLKKMHDLTKVRDASDDVALRGLIEGGGEGAVQGSDGPGDPYAAAPPSRQLPPASGGGDRDWIEVDGQWGYREDFRARGVKA